MTTTQMVGGAVGFAPGMRVRARDEEWIVREVQPMGGGHRALRCVGATELVRGHETILLTTIDRDIAPVRVEDTGLVDDHTPAYRKSRLFIESLLRRSPPTDSALYVGHRAALRPSNYQLRPAEDALKALRPRILIADGVGLGKTLEVGVLLSELIVRGRGDRILVVVMKSMLAQFQRELWTRFTIPLVRLDSEGIQRVRSRIPTGKNPFHTFKRAIISIDTLKNERQYRPWLEECRWDAVVIDECHNAINIGTGRQRVASLLARTTDALILASATPHNGRPESFANLMSMLEPTAIANPSSYTKDDIQGLYRRRFKKDIEHEVRETFPERDPQLVWAKANADEEAVFSAIHEATFRTLDRTTKVGGRARDVLFKTVLLKGFLSSPQAFVQTCDERLAHIEERLEKVDGAGQTSLLGRDLEEDRATLLHLRDLALRIQAPTKMERLFADVLPALGLKGDKGNDPRIVIFSERRATLEALEHALATRWNLHTNPEKPADAHVAVLTGAESDTRIQDILESFSSKDGAVKVLLASDMASEGINLHHTCSRLVHFDVPWSLIRLEQRSGRIDRYGQLEVPRIRYLLNQTETAARSDVHVIETLIEKEKAARDNLGDVGALMGLHDATAEEEHIAVGISAQMGFDDVVGAAHEVAAAAAADATVSADDDIVDGADFLAALFGDVPETAQEPPPPVAARPSLFADDLAFFKEALTEVEPALVDEADGPFRLELRPHPERPELTLRVPADLKRRFEDLPPEARPREDTLWVSTDRDAVMREIATSRDHRGAWPALQLLWPLHPAVSWVADRVLVGFGRHEAPIVVAPGLAADDGDGDDEHDDEWRRGHDAVALFEGTVSNRLGQPLIVDWFGLPTRLSANGSADVGVPMSLDELVRLTGLSGRLPNPGKSQLKKAHLEGARPAWAAAALQRMNTLRGERSRTLVETVRDGERKAMQWHARTREDLEAKRSAQQASLSGRRQAAALKLLDHEAAEVDKVRQSRVDWLRKRFTSDATPWVRLVAVFVAR
jgi:superfamily II DNA or RNA helicase